MNACFTCNKVADDHCLTSYDGKHFHQGACLQGYIDRKNISADTFAKLDQLVKVPNWPVTMPSADKIWS